MPTECIELLAIRPGATIVDGTLGGGGHTRLIAELVGSEGRVLSLDRDWSVIQRARQNSIHPSVIPVHASYHELDQVMKAMEVDRVHGILLDLGLSSDQLEDNERGFSYNASGELDLRFDTTTGQPASEMLAKMREQDIANLIYQFGEERYSRRIARKIVEQRRSRPVRTAPQLADLVRSCVPRSRGHNIDPATRTFQALRIAVNDELGILETGLQVAARSLAPGGRIVVISFHSLEDRIVKHSLRQNELLTVLTKKPVLPTDEEIHRNPRSRSAKVRAAEKR